ncbi:MAG: alpha/beta hydrolase [Pseudomonadota bacterium]
MKSMTTMKPFLACLILFMQVAGANAAAPSLQPPVLLWPEGAPGATGSSPEDKPAVTPFLPDEKNRNGTAILVIPGGGYTIRAVDHEGVLAAQWLRDHGYTAFLLRYRLNPLYEREHWVADGERAMRYIRAHARDYGIDPTRVGALGFSAGSNLLVDLMLHIKPGDPAARDPLDRLSTRPDFLVLGYGFMQIPQNTDPKVVAAFPPTFFYCTVEDRSNVLNMLTLQSTLIRNNVPVEAHYFEHGIHGTGFGLGDPVLGQWPGLLDNWVRTNGLLTGGKRIALTGMLSLDGSPLQKGMLILRPRDDPRAPTVVVYQNNTGTGPLGQFIVPASQGPVPGRYQVEVRQDATRWISNSREPFMIEMMAKQRANTLTEEDRRRWGEYLRQRDLSPSIDRQRVFSRQHPGDTRDYVVEIAAGRELIIDVYSR